MMGVREIGRSLEHRSLEQCQMEVKDLRRRMILAPTPRERERWYAIWLLAQGWAASATAEELERAPHHRTVGFSFRRGRAGGLDIRAERWFPPSLTKRSRQS